MRERTKLWWVLGGGGCAFLALLLFSVSSQVCLSAFFTHRMLVAQCPDGDVVPGVTLEASALRRGQAARVSIGAFMRYTTASVDEVQTAPLRRFDARLDLVVDGKVTPLLPEEPWTIDRGEHRATGLVTLPQDLPDGDHALRATVVTASGEELSLDAVLRLYAPAKVHLITDRPLYEPGNTIRFRAVVLRARDLVPIDGRPGRFIVEDPSGEVVLEEEAAAGPFGVVAGELPLDIGAPVGVWSVRWQSADASEAVAVRVEPFTLPRFTVEVAPIRAYYLPGDRPVLRGRVVYSSGAPVEADLALAWRVSGDWPAPTSWEKGALPTEAKTAAGGWFEVDLPEVPADLRGKVTLAVTATALDPTGDRATGHGAVLLSQHAIDVEAVTELDGGLVEGVNNRVYLRATSAGGDVLGGVSLHVKRTWDPADRGVVVTTDADGVAALQLDPGPAVNIVIPPMPVRPTARPAPIERVSVSELVRGEPPTLAELREMDRWNESLAPCARFVQGQRVAQLSVRLDPSGGVLGVVAEDAPSRCLGEVIRRSRLPAGGPRILQLGYRLHGDMASLESETGGTSSLPPVVASALATAALDARSCLSDDSDGVALPRMALWQVEDGRFSASFAADPAASPSLSSRQASCVEAKLAPALKARVLSTSASDEAAADAFGWVRYVVRPAPRVSSQKPQATVMLGYELSVTATAEEERIGDTVLRLRPGSVPPIRLRATPPLPQAGGTVTVEVLRGPNHAGGLPEELTLVHDQRALVEKLDEKTRSTTFTLPDDLTGWFQVVHQGARAQVYVRPKGELTVDVAAAQPSYRPKEKARLDVLTTSGGKPIRAAVGLFGVDETLAVLAPLPGPDDMGRVRSTASMSRVAFNALHVNALMQGRIRGENAAAATVLLVTDVPRPAEIDTFVTVVGATPFDPNERLTDHFYILLSELHSAVRRWERSAPKAEQMTPARMMKMWADVMEVCRARGDDVTDAFGRPLLLTRLPDDLLELVDPRAVVIEGTRLPEDVESWTAFVRRGAP